MRDLLHNLVRMSVVCWCLALVQPAVAKKHPSVDFRPVRLSMLSITSKESGQHVYLLASDELQGRETGTPGQWLAAKYIAHEFRRYGLKPAGKNDTYYQNFQLEYPRLQEARLSLLIGDDKPLSLQLNEDFVPFIFTGENSVTAPLVFAGYGITAPEYHYDDYRDLDVRGKIVIVLRHEPQENKRSSIFAGSRFTKHAFFEEKAQNARRHGAVAMLLVNDPANHSGSAPPDGVWDAFNKSIHTRHNWRLKQPALQHFPAFWIGRSVAYMLFENSGKRLLDYQKRIDSTLAPQSFPFRGIQAFIVLRKHHKSKETQNVVALLPGSDPVLRDEIVIIGAHYDHLGARNGRIYNGADDNASGTAGMLEIAEAFAKMPLPPRRSLLFIAFSAEEMGLLGSEYYVKHPLVPLDKTVAMINLDMIGRNAPNRVSIIGTNRTPALTRLNQLANREIRLELLFEGEKYFDRSDQASFARAGIPVIFYNTDVHEDYHRSTDTSDKIDTKKIARISRLAFLVAWELANSDVRPGNSDFMTTIR